MPETTVAAIITTTDKSGTRVLLTRRGVEPFRGQWCLPGGHIDEYELARKAIIREVKEETGLDFDPRFFAYFDEIIPERGLHAVVLVYDGPVTGTAAIEKGEVSDIRWFSITKALALPLAFGHHEILSAYAQHNITLPSRRGRGESLKEARHS